MYYVIRVGGHLDQTWADWFEGLGVNNQEQGEAVLAGHLPDQVALYSVLARLGVLNVPLISVARALPSDDIGASIAPTNPRGRKGAQQHKVIRE
jgi:hypothetical protein